MLLRNETTSIIFSKSNLPSLCCSLLQRNILVWISYFFVWIRVVWVVGNRWFKIKRIFHNAMDESKILFHKIIFRANIIYVEWEIILINWKKLIDNKKVKKVHFGIIYFLIYRLISYKKTIRPFIANNYINLETISTSILRNKKNTITLSFIT